MEYKDYNINPAYVGFTVTHNDSETLCIPCDTEDEAKEEIHCLRNEDENGNELSCCGDVLEEESGFLCKTCGEHN
jgi:hypothetical protein